MKLTLDPKLIGKYNRPGPRYTSYPPATKFTPTVKWDEIKKRILRTNSSPSSISLYFHIPFCESLCWFCACNSVTSTDRRKSFLYILKLIREIELASEWINFSRPVTQLHLGGGTPTFCSPEELLMLGEMLWRRFKFADDFEGGVEVDPRGLTKRHLEVLRQIGFNRISIGVQDFDPEVQKTVHRLQPFSLTHRVIQWARELGFSSINIDLIYGLPKQTLITFEKTLEQVLSLRPERLVVFSYAHVPWLKPAQKILEKVGLPSPELKLQLLQLAIDTLTHAGYIYIGMDHFALPNDELVKAQNEGTLQRNFQGYSTKAGTDIFAFGVSAISQVKDAYWQNEKELVNYEHMIEQGLPPYKRGYCLSEEDILRRYIIMELMCNMKVSFERIATNFGIKFQDHFSNELQTLYKLQEDGLVKIESDYIKVTDIGRFFIRAIAMIFDQYIARESNSKHSMIV